MRKLVLLWGITVLVSCSGYFQPDAQRNIDSKVNTLALSGGGYLSSDTANDTTPFLFYDTDGTPYLFFSSDRDGNYDIFYAKMNPDGTFESPVKLSFLVNSASNEIAPVVFSDNYGGKYLLFIRYASNSPGSSSEMDSVYITNGFDPLYTSSGLSFFTNLMRSIGLYNSGGGYATIYLTDGSTNVRVYYNGDGWLNNGSLGFPENVDSIAFYGNSSLQYYLFASSSLQLKGAYFVNGQQPTWGYFDIKDYSSGSHDTAPFVDQKTGKVYFASDRYGKGNLDLYRYNQNTFDKEIPRVQAPPLASVRK